MNRNNSNEELMRNIENGGMAVWRGLRPLVDPLVKFVTTNNGPMDVVSKISGAVAIISFISLILFIPASNILNLAGPIRGIFGFILMIGSGAGFIICLLTIQLHGKKGPDWYHGTARLAKRKELEDLITPHGKPVPPGGFIVSVIQDGPVVLPRTLALQHGIIIGAPGTGKSRGYYLPNCAWSNNSSIVVTDPKSELFEHTSGFHKNVKRYAPTEPDKSEGFNWVPLCTNVRMAQLCAQAILESTKGDGGHEFYTLAETAFLTGLFAHTATLEQPTPLTAFKLFARQSDEVLLEQLRTSKSEIAREQREIYLKTSPNIRGGIAPGIFNKLQWLRDPDIQRYTSASLEPPNFGSLRSVPQAIYYCMREQDITRLKPLTSLFFAVLTEQITGRSVKEELSAVPVTVLLDEFANIGVIPDFDSSLTLARGRGIAFFLGLQAIAQLPLRYGEAAAKTILAATSTKILMHGLDLDTAKYASEMLGSRTVVAPHMSSTPTGWFKESNTYSQQEHQRPLMTPDEVMRIKENEALIRIGNRYPMILPKITYKERPKTATIKGLGEAISVAIEANAIERRASVLDEDPPSLT